MPAKMGQRKFTVEGVAKALRECRGNVWATAESLGASRSTIYKMISEFPELDRVRAEARSEMLDAAELVVERNILKALAAHDREDSQVDSTDAKWYLARIGRYRGYGDTTQVTSPPDEPVEVVIRYEKR